ncbi:hypothetical protein VTK73DRAFT_1300 [Phialemonium thermophilum]|uniref:DUF4185 domain-containing protein n=1 Tax=Phialemonium thermophilum TaxID=223376 RepID=A0ABR3VTN7_9PEZI
MHRNNLFCVLGFSIRARASPQDEPKRGIDLQEAGPISVAHVERLGLQTSVNSCSHRDLGFTGSIRGQWYSVFGDTLWCQPGVTDPEADTPGFHGMVRNSIARLTPDPLKVVDLHLNNDTPVCHPLQFLRANPAWNETENYFFGVSSLLETDNRNSATAAMFYLINGTGTGVGPSGRPIGAGVARVEVIDDAPTVTRRYGDRGFWWNATDTPRYGDIAAYRDVNSDYIYVWGGPPLAVDRPGDPWDQRVYLARVPAAYAFQLDMYQYYWGPRRGWRTGKPLTRFDDETAVLRGVGQGQVVFNRYYSRYLFVHTGFLDLTVYIKTAKTPLGPWTASAKVYTTKLIGDGLVYAGVVYPHYDESGKTLVIGYTNNNHIELIRVTFAGGADRQTPSPKPSLVPVPPPPRTTRPPASPAAPAH